MILKILTFHHITPKNRCNCSVQFFKFSIFFSSSYTHDLKGLSGQISLENNSIFILEGTTWGFFWILAFFSKLSPPHSIIFTPSYLLYVCVCLLNQAHQSQIFLFVCWVCFFHSDHFSFFSFYLFDSLLSWLFSLLQPQFMG